MGIGYNTILGTSSSSGTGTITVCGNITTGTASFASSFSNSSNSYISSNSGMVLGSNGWGSITVKNDMLDFCELVLSALGHDVKYNDFCKMSDVERKSLLRDIKIKRVLE
jgi:nitrate/nitrite transporter NarK